MIVAEVSANHGQNFNRAVKMIRSAKKCGADAVKCQAYTPDTLTLACDNKYFQIKHTQWKGQTLHKLYQKTYTPWNWFKRLKKVADEEGVLFFATAFDKTSVDFLEEIGVPFHKAASFELVDLPLIEYMAKTEKPLILSTGMATVAEIKEAMDTARKNGAKDITLLKCVSSYPADPKEMNLRTIPDMQKMFQCDIGLSDHSLGIHAAIASGVLGATMIEKHFILSKSVKTPDSDFSIDPKEFKEMVKSVRMAETMLGDVHYGVTKDGERNRIFRRSLFVVADIEKGASLTEQNVRSIRPGHGLSPKYFDEVIGKKVKQNIKKGTPLSFDLIQV
jgi:pseudaminic acid synthase